AGHRPGAVPRRLRRVAHRPAGGVRRRSAPGGGRRCFCRLAGIRYRDGASPGGRSPPDPPCSRGGYPPPRTPLGAGAAGLHPLLAAREGPGAGREPAGRGPPVPGQGGPAYSRAYSRAGPGRGGGADADRGLRGRAGLRHGRAGGARRGDRNGEPGPALRPGPWRLRGLGPGGAGATGDRARTILRRGPDPRRPRPPDRGHGHGGGRRAVLAPGLRLEPGSDGELQVRVTSGLASELRGEAQLVSPFGSWEMLEPWTQGFSVAPGASTVLRFAVHVPATARHAQWWALVKVMYYGRVRYTEAIPVVIGPVN